MATSFQHHLMALSSEFERLVVENAELKKRSEKYDQQFDEQLEKQLEQLDVHPRSNESAFGGFGSETLWQLRSLDPSICAPPAPPIAQDLKYLDEPENGKEDVSIQKDPKDCHLCPPTLGGHLPGAIEDEAEAPPKSPRSEQSHARTPRSSGIRHVRDIDDPNESEDNATFLLLLDAVPALVILTSAAVAGISADIAANHFGWQILEIVFTVFFIGELALKTKVFGMKEFFWGADWYWTWFDLLCIILALTEMALAATTDGAGGPIGLLKMLKLARLGRIIRLLKFKIFQELKLMIQGVFTGLRVLFWAVVLLISCVYLLGVFTKTIFGDVAEFATVPDAMFTWFRCFTDGCTTFGGAPLQAYLYQRIDVQDGPGRALLMMSYILLFLFVTIGVFNLIMAVFIDNVMDGSTKKRQRELGHNAPRTGWVIASELRHLILANELKKEAEDEAAAEEASGVERPRRPSKILQEKILNLREMYGYRPHTTQEYDDLTEQIREEMASRGLLVTRAEFNNWLATEKGLLETLADAEIDLSCKSDLFDVLDADLSGELEFEEMVEGLLKCRGPASKTDIIAIRLKTRLLVRMVTRICEKLEIEV